MNVNIINSIEDAIEAGDLSKCMTLLEANPKALHEQTTFGTWLHVAASHGHVAIVKELLKRGMDINARAGIAGGTPLHSAVEDNQYEVAKHLLDVGAQMDVSEPERNPLFAAIIEDNVKIAKLLIDRGIDVEVKYTGEYMKNMDAIAFAEERGAGHCLNLLQETKKKANPKK